MTPQETVKMASKSFSGRLYVRVPPYLHEKLAKTAADQGVSLNALIQMCLAESAARLAADKRIRKLERRADDEPR